MTITEVVMAATVCVAIIGSFAPIAVGTSRVLRDARIHRLAVEELTNQLSVLVRLPQSQRQAALQDLAVSTNLAKSLPGAHFEHQIIQDEDGDRILLTLEWDREMPGLPISLMAWFDKDSNDQEKPDAKP